VCAIEDCVSSHHAQPSICRHVNWTLFSSHSKISSSFRDPRLFETIVTEFIRGFVPYRPGDCKNLEVKYEDNTQFEERSLPGKT